MLVGDKAGEVNGSMTPKAVQLADEPGLVPGSLRSPCFGLGFNGFMKLLRCFCR